MIGKLNHVGVATPSIEQSVKLYREVFGATDVTEKWSMPEQGVWVCFVNLPNAQIELIEPYGENSPITFRVQAVPSRDFKAKLYHIGEVADSTTRMVECFAWVENPGRSLRPGFFADVTATIEQRSGALVVPQTAVIPTDQGFVGFVLKGEDQVERRVLKLGLYTREGNVEVLEGLEEGDRLVTRGAASLSESSRVVVTSSPAEDRSASEGNEGPGGGPGPASSTAGPGASSATSAPAGGGGR